MNKKLIRSLLVFLMFFGAFEAFGATARKRKKMGNLTLQKLKSAVPPAKAIPKKKVRQRNVGLVKPPSSSKLYAFEDDPLKAEYNALVDEEIKRLFSLSKKFKKSPARGEIWIRLGERYVEKAQIIDFKIQDKYDRQLKAFQEGKTKRRPRPPSTREVKNYHKRAIRLYEWYVRDFPKSDKVPQALYFLGYNNFEIGQSGKGEKYYKELTRRFPKSVYVAESHFALGEFYFEKENWKPALFEYNKVVQKKRSHLFSFALYKAAWCHYRLGNYKTAIKSLEKVIRVSRSSDNGKKAAGTRSVNKLGLLKEAVGDYVNFYEQTGKYKQAYDDFMNVSRSEKRTTDMLDQLAYRYSYSGNLPASKYLFGQLIAMAPTAPKAAKYQYQIVQDFGSTGRVKDFRRELTIWLDQFGRQSSWAKRNAKDGKLIKENYDLQESTLRNHTLQLHNQAVNARTQYSKKLAANSYKMYLSYFRKSKNYSEMRFFYAELLYDLQEYDQAAAQYEWVALNDKKSKYFKNAVENNVLAREKKVPSDAKMDAVRKAQKDKLRAIPLSKEVKAFERASIIYLKAFPKGDKALDIKRRLGTIYYAHNQFDSSIKVLRQIVKDKPRSKDAQVAAEVILDIHRLRNDLTAFQAEGNALLKNPAIANSKFGKDLRLNLEKAKFLVADNYSKKGNHLKAAKAFEAFAGTNPRSDQAFSALYNSAVNFDKTGSQPDAVRMYKKVIAKPTKNKKDLGLKQDARNSLAKNYKKMGRLADAATYYEAFGRTGKGAAAAAAVFNAAVLWDALNRYTKAFSAYNYYAKLGKKKEEQEAAWAKAEMYKRQNQYSKAIYQYNKYITLNAPDLEKVIKAHYTIGNFYKKLGNRTKAKPWFKKTIAIVRGSSRARKVGAQYAAPASYFIARDTLREMRNVRLGNREKSIQKGFEKMKSLRGRLLKDMAKVIKFDHGPSIVAALSGEAEANEIIGRSWQTLNVPVEFAKTTEMRKKFKELSSQQANDFLGKAIVSYRNAFEKGISLKAYGPEMLSSAQALYRLDPKGFNQAGEVNQVGELIDMVGI